MPRQCKGTREAVINRINAVERHRRMTNCQQGTIIDISCFGIKHRIKREGIFTIEDLIKELNNE
jgi:hypothetical protein